MSEVGTGLSIVFASSRRERIDLLWPKERLLVPGTAENDVNMHWIMSGIEKQGKTPPSAWPAAAQSVGLLPPDWVTTTDSAEVAAEVEAEEKVPATAGAAAE